MLRLITGACCLVCAQTATGLVPQDDGERPYLQAAIEAGQWIRASAIETQYGITWPMAPDDSDVIVRHLYSGSAGAILFFTELSRQTGDGTWLTDARAGADELLAWFDAQPDKSKLEMSLWTGLAGKAFTLHRLYLATEDERYLRTAREMLEILHVPAMPGRWNDTTDIIRGSAGIGLFLLYAAEHMDDPRALELAEAAGLDLIAQAQDRGIDRYDWYMTPDYARRMPNFSHGTAGVAFFLARLHEEAVRRGRVAHEDSLALHAALAGAAYLRAIANHADSGCVIFHHEPGGEDLYYLGWCHGPAGTSLLFRQLAIVTQDDGWRELARAGLRSLLGAGIPEKRTPGFWNNLGPCCGSAGAARFALDMWRVDGQDEQLAFARRLTNDLLTRSTPIKTVGAPKGRKWVQAEHRVQPDLLVAQTGYMQGAAGIGLWLLELDAALRGEGPLLVFPDALPAAR